MIYEMNHTLNCAYARIIASLDFIFAVQYLVHFIYHDEVQGTFLVILYRQNMQDLHNKLAIVIETL